MEKELIAIEKQLEFALDELKSTNPDKQLIFDYVENSLQRVKKLKSVKKDNISPFYICPNCQKIHKEYSDAARCCYV